MQKVRRHYVNSSDCLFVLDFRFYFTPFVRVLFTFPSRYLFTIGHLEYLGLEGGPPVFRQNFTCFVLLIILVHIVIYTGLSPIYGSIFQCISSFCVQV